MCNNQSSLQALKQPYFLQSKLQKRIYARLLFFGAAPAIFYRETRHLITSTRPLMRITSFVTGLLQEIEISLRKMFLPYSFTTLPDYEIDKRSSEYYKKEIELISYTYDLPWNLQRQWIEVATQIRDIHQLVVAHIEDPLFFLAPDFRSETLLTSIEFTVDAVLDLFEEKFIRIFALLDTFLLQEKPNSTILANLGNKVPHNYATHTYFFSRLYHPGWLEPLYSNGFFAYPPPKSEIEGSSIPNFFFWPQLHYLLRMASIESAQLAVWIIIQSISATDNAYIYPYITHIKQILSKPMLSGQYV